MSHIVHQAGEDKSVYAVVKKTKHWLEAGRLHYFNDFSYLPYSSKRGVNFVHVKVDGHRVNRTKVTVMCEVNMTRK